MIKPTPLPQSSDDPATVFLGDLSASFLGHLEKISLDINMSSAVLQDLSTLFPQLDLLSPCPGCDQPTVMPMALWQIVTHLNDDHGWTRERVAEWLDTAVLDM